MMKVAPEFWTAEYIANKGKYYLNLNMKMQGENEI